MGLRKTGFEESQKGMTGKATVCVVAKGGVEERRQLVASQTEGEKARAPVSNLKRRENLARALQ
jgi:hypothetical protein